MDEEEYESCIEPERIKKERNFSEYLDASIIVIIAVLFIAIGCTFFIEFVFGAEINWAEISANSVSICACTIAIYLLLRSYAMRKGRKMPEWQEAHKRLTERGAEIIKHNRARLIPKYCREWESDRLDNDIENVLVLCGITLEEYRTLYAKYSDKELKEKYPELTEYQVKLISRAKRIKRLRFDERYFYVNAVKRRLRRSPSGEPDSKQVNRLATARIALTSILTSVISATFLYDVIFNFSAESVVKCVIKLAITVFFGALGMIGGYNHAAVRETSEMLRKADDIQDFLNWCGEYD